MSPKVLSLPTELLCVALVGASLKTYPEEVQKQVSVAAILGEYQMASEEQRAIVIKTIDVGLDYLEEKVAMARAAISALVEQSQNDQAGN